MSISSRKMKIAVTGASGFLGRNLIKMLREDNRYIVHAITSRADSSRSTNTDDHVRYHDRDAIFTNNDEEIFYGSTVINCAFPRNSNGTEMAEGLEYTQHLFRIAHRCLAKAIVNISTQSVYPTNKTEAATEQSPVSLDTVYSVGKYATELMLIASCSSSDTNYTNLRMASLIGPGFNQRITNRFVQQALIDKRLNVVLSKKIYGYLDVMDAVTGIMTLINTQSDSWSSLYNLGPKDGYSIRDIAGFVCEVAEEFSIGPVTCVFEHSNEYSNSLLDSSKFYDELMWHPSIPMRESIRRIFSYETGVVK
jgi:nucleoside-diphosphate-sugar epimerase